METEEAQIDLSYDIIRDYGDADMTRDEIFTLLTMNDIPEEVAYKVADDIRPD